MKKVLLISNYVFHYRQKIYNCFSRRFLEDGYELHVLADAYQEVGYESLFIRHVLPFSVNGYERKIDEISPDVVIVFLHLKDRVQIPLIHYCKRKRIPVIFWNKGVSSTDPDNPLKNIFYHHIHNSCDALLTYTPLTAAFFQKKNHKKLFIAYNTVDCSDINKSKYKAAGLREKYGIKENRVVLYVSRLKKTKRVDILLKALAGQPDIAVVVMGEGITSELESMFASASNLYYVGQKYGEEGNEIWAMGDVFSIPLSCGLGINEAIFWNMPIVTMKGDQTPEIYYVKEGKTGYIAENEKDYKEKLLSLLNDNELLARMKEECRKEYEEEVSIDKMYKGFIDAVRYCRKEYRQKK